MAVCACLAVAGFEDLRAERLFSDTHSVVVCGDFVVGFALVARPVVELVRTVFDDVDADSIVVLNLVYAADLQATFSAGVSLDFAVLDWCTADVIGDFHVVTLAVEARPRALLVYAVRYSSDAHVLVLCKVLPVEAF